MPDLSGTVRWLEFVPDLMGNRDSERPFYLLLNGSMSKDQLRALDAAIERPSALPDLVADATDEQKAAHKEAARLELVDRYSKALEPYIKLGEEPLTVDGRGITTLRDYFDLVTSPLLTGLGAFFEPFTALTSANAMDVSTSFSSGRLSGGFISTGRRRPGGRAAAR